MNSRTIEEMIEGIYGIRIQEDPRPPSPVKHIKPPKNSGEPMSEKEIRRFKAAKILAKLPQARKDEIINTLEFAEQGLPDKYVDYILKQYGKES